MNRHQLAGRIGAFAQQARNDTRETTEAARRAFKNSFLDEVDPEGKLPEGERQRRAEAARRAWYSRLAMKSAQSRQKRTRKAGAAGTAPAKEDGNASAENP